jgi:drug/metabolite transporter (DMT)-like permease
MKLQGILMVFAGACSYGILSTFVKLAYAEGYTLGDVTGSQAFLGMLILWMIYFFQKTTSPKNAYTAPQKKSTYPKLFISGITMGLVSLLYYSCVKEIPASIAIILLMQFSWITILLEGIFFNKKPTLLEIISILIVLLGTAFASGIFSKELATLNLKGFIYGILAAVSYSIFILVSGKIGKNINPIKKSALLVSGACTFIFIILPPTFLFSGLLFTGLLKWGIILALFGTVIPPLFYSKGVPIVGVGLSSILSAAELPVAVMMSYFILHEEVSLLQWMGVIVILFAITLPNLKKTIGEK